MKFKNGSTIDFGKNLVQDAIERLAGQMALSVDQQFFLQTDYQIKHRTWWEKFIDWKHEMSNRVDLAIEVLQGKHYCSDEY